MHMIRFILLIAIGLQPVTMLQAGGVDGLGEPSNICCSDDCACILSAACACHEEPSRPAPAPPTSPAPERVPVERLFDQVQLYSYDIEPIEQRYENAPFESLTYRQDDLDDRHPLLCLWLI
ncbi:MAG: hypothetical protein AAF085_09535 [Planctomycetota bacterium]